MSLLKIIFFNPLYNALFFISAHLPAFDLGLAIIVLTIIVKFILLPFYHQSLVTQIKIKKIEPEVNKIKSESKGDKTEETKKLLTLYKENKINPFIGFVVVLVQLPIILALFYVFKDSLIVNQDLIYPFLKIPTQTNHIFLNILDITHRSYLAAAITGITQFIQIKLSLPSLPQTTNNERSMKDDLVKSMHFQMKYFMPIVITVVAAGLPAALSLYWITSNLFAIGYELLVRRRLVAESRS